jgi:hypothetical protein
MKLGICTLFEIFTAVTEGDVSPCNLLVDADVLVGCYSSIFVVQY